MKVVVTGGAGFIGSHLCDALLANNHSVTVIDDLSTGSLENISQNINNPNFKFIRGSILDQNIFLMLPEKIDVIYHLAAAVGVKYIIDNPLQSIHTNVMGTENVLGFANKHKIKVILTSTSEVYGKNNKESLSENDDRILGSTYITRWSYASSKALDEFISFAYYRKHKLPIIITRLFNTCGPRQTDRYGMVIPRFIQQALKGEPITVYSDGGQIRSFTYVSDTVSALMKLAEDDVCVGEVFNIGGQDPVDMKTLAHMVKEMTGSSSRIVFIPYKEAYGDGFEDMQRRVPNITKIQNFIQFKPQVNLQNILEKTIKYVTKEFCLVSNKI